MINNVLFICVGNICRSPMAEGLFKQLLPEKLVFSAGINALIGEPADPFAVQLMRERGMDISAHRARYLATWMVCEADLILTMDQGQKYFVESKYPAIKSKVFRFGEFGGYDIPDPYQRGMAAFRESFNLIIHGMDEMMAQISDFNNEKKAE